ncbi:substrate-binding domain-containing protein [Geminisphaera colitermitum]|uniref:substrate-binding domain-containing protein n=1 Tax=Geminisphaera colitermitum TaxID=1148786 RepID=UPI000158D4CD|nr:substrate-binding domain-containing protein [Geminisphaera colitermitum]
MVSSISNSPIADCPDPSIPPPLLRLDREQNPNGKKHSHWDWEKQIRSIVLDREGGIPLHVQLRTSLRRVIQSTPTHVEKLTPENTLTELLGVSQATVRTALNGLVEEGLIQRKRALGTVITRPVQGTLLKHVAVIAPNFPSYTQNAHLSALNALTSAQGTTLTLISFEKSDDWQACKRQITFGPAEGALVFLHNAPHTTIDLHGLLFQEGYRSVNIGPPLSGCLCNSVGISNRAFVRLGLQRLIAAGHRRILFLVSEPEEVPEVIERVTYFEEAACEFGLAVPDEAEVLHCGTHSWENSSEASAHTVEKFWQQRPVAHRPTAIFGISDGAAAGALFGLNRIGIRVPDDVSILSYDGTELTRIVQPKLSTLVTPMDTFAAAVLNLLNTGASDSHIFIDPEFREGDSLRTLTAVQ